MTDRELLRRIVVAFDMHDELFDMGDDVGAMFVWAEELLPALAEARERLATSGTEEKR